jgi:Family of unknown function (DUF5317)
VVALLFPGFGATLIALIGGRSVAGLKNQRIVWWPLAFGGFCAEFALSSTPLGRHPLISAWGSAIWLGALAATVAMLARNAWLRRSSVRYAWAIAATGVLLNFIVVAANNGEMPQSQEARIAAGASEERVAGLTSEPGWHNVAAMTSETRLGWLGDVLPEPAWLPIHNVMSLGDLVLASGIAGVVFLSTTPRCRPASAEAIGDTQ